MELTEFIELRCEEEPEAEGFLGILLENAEPSELIELRESLLDWVLCGYGFPEEDDDFIDPVEVIDSRLLLVNVLSGSFGADADCFKLSVFADSKLEFTLNPD